MSTAMVATGSAASPRHHVDHGASDLNKRGQLPGSMETHSPENGSGGTVQESRPTESSREFDDGSQSGRPESNAEVVARAADDLSYETELHEILLSVAQSGSCSWLPWAEHEFPAKHAEGSDEPSAAFLQRNGHALAFDETVPSSHHHKELDAFSGDHHLSTSRTDRAMKHLHYPNGMSRGCRKRPLFLTRGGDSTRNDSGTSAAQKAAGTFAAMDAETHGHSCLGSGDAAPIQPDDHPEATVKKPRVSDSEANSNAPNPPFFSRESMDNGNDDTQIASAFSCQRMAFRVAISMVLDHFYRQKGYKLNSLERQRYAQPQAESQTSEPGLTRQDGTSDRESNMHGIRDLSIKMDTSHKDYVTHSAETEGLRMEQNAYSQRRERLLKLLESPEATLTVESADAPFTLQRVAEVLLAPGRYYTQTHKLCNSLEKLLLITASETEFRGDLGGEGTESLLELQEIADVADAHERFHLEVRKQRLQKRSSLYSENEKDVSVDDCDVKTRENDVVNVHAECSRELFLEAAARASLRTKFDHVGIDAHAVAVASRDTHAIVAARGMNNSPPPPGCSITSAMTGLSLPGHGQLLRHKDGEHLHAAVRASPSILHNPDADRHGSLPLGALHTSTSLQLLQLHHAAALAGVSPLDVLNLQEGNPSVVATLATIGNAGRETDAESRSSCSSDIDLDSESDVSFDDSASDRSDGSDSGHVESMSAVRAMAMNRIQYQQRLQSRMLISLNQSSNAGHTQGESPRSDRETQVREVESDDGASPRAEDATWSDSSSPDNEQQ